jgi:hypothetical protein
MCRFLLDIRHLNEHSNGMSHNSLPINSFRAVTKGVGEAIAEEFGDPIYIESHGDTGMYGGH